MNENNANNKPLSDTVEPVDNLDPVVPDAAETEVIPTSEPTTVLQREPGTLSQPVGETAAPTEVIAPPAPAPVQPVTLADDQKVIIDKSDVAMIDAKRGTIDLGILILRVVFGLVLITEAIKVFFNLGGSGGLAGLTDMYAAYAMPRVLAVLVPALQLTAGVFLVIGLLTPFAAALALAVTIFTTVHEFVINDTLNFWAWPAPVVLGITLLAMSLAIQFTGPGKASLDFSRSWAKRPLVSSWILVIIGIAIGVVMWWFGAGVNPFAL